VHYDIHRPGFVVGGLAPWIKAQEWLEAAPELAGEIVEMGKKRALQVWELEQRREKHQQELERDEAIHRHKQEFRLWLLQLISVLGGFLAVAVNALIAYKYAASGNVIPGSRSFCGLRSSNKRHLFGRPRRTSKAGERPRGAEPAGSRSIFGTKCTYRSDLNSPPPSNVGTNKAGTLLCNGQI
jgi:hypothetical protein